MSASPNNPNLRFGQDASALKAVPLFTPTRPVVPLGHETLQALLAFSSLHQQIKNKKEVYSDEPVTSTNAGREQFVLAEVLKLVAERAVALTGADGVAIALAEGDAIICRASTGEMAPDTKAKLNPSSGFSGACFRTGKIIRCNDTENDARVNVAAAQRLGVRSMVAVPLTGRSGTLGLIEAFSSKAFGFDDSDIRTLNLLAELVLGAMKPEDESRMAEVSQLVTKQAEETTPEVEAAPVIEAPQNVAPDLPAAVEQETTALPEPVISPELASDKPASSLPPLKIVLASVLVAIVLGLGIWWKHHSAQSAVNATSHAAVTPAQTEQNIELTSSESQSAQRPDGLTSVTGIRHWSSPGSSTVVIDLQDQVQYEQHRLSDPERIYFDLHDTVLPRELFGKVIEVGDSLLVRVRVAQPTSGVTRVVLETKNNPTPSVSLEQNPYRLVLQVRSADAPAQPNKAKVDLFAPATPQVEQQAANQPQAPAPAQAPAVQKAAPAMQAESKRVLPQVAKFRIALDAGHGGWDEGTIGRKGLMEKDLALDIVTRLGKLVSERQGADVIYTRSNDIYIPLEKRAEIANVAQADLFVSVHANYSDFRSARGVETYYTNTYSSMNARTPESDNTVQPVNWTNVDIREKSLQSQKLAASVQRALYGKLAPENPGLRDRGIKRASYVVLTGTTMPAILAEVSFMSSPTDEKSLKSAAYRQRIAEALYRGIVNYTAEQHKVTMASSAGKPTGH